MSSAAAIALLKALAALDGLEDPAVGGLEVEATDVRYIEARWSETVVRARPWVPRKRVGTVGKGTRLAVRGIVQSRDEKGCHGKPWYAVQPFGFVCSEQARPADDPPGHGLALPLTDGSRLPFTYVTVRHDEVPRYANLDELRTDMASRQVYKGMSLAVSRQVVVDGGQYIQTLDGSMVPREAVGYMGQGSDWHGVALAGVTEGPVMAWVRPKKGQVFDRPDGEVVDRLPIRTIVDLLEPKRTGERASHWRIGPDRWMRAKDLNEVIVQAPPEGVLPTEGLSALGNDQWIDVDLGEQVLVAYRGATPVFATLVSSGRASPTPLGNYPIWAKVAAMDMANQAYEDRPYLVERVPWVLLFQGHNALHGAYWHNRFGNRKSHGCVNLSPRDARWVFEWVAPPLPDGWTGYLPEDMGRSVVVHVRNSSKAPGQQFVQERPPGPPDREQERKRLEEAEARRALALAATLDAPAEPEPGVAEVSPEVQRPATHPLRLGAPPAPDLVPPPQPRPQTGPNTRQDRRPNADPEREGTRSSLDARGAPR